MKRMSNSLAIAAIIAFPAIAVAQEPTEEAMAAYVAAAAPGEPHQWLSELAGDYEVTVKSWMDPAAPEPMVSTASAHSEMALGGRYLVEVYEGSFGGIAFEGHGVTAYDNTLDRYVSTWIDNMGTGIMVSEGKRDEEGRLVMIGTVVDPVSGDEVKVKSVTTLTGDGSVTEMHNILPDGTSFKSMEIVSKRKM